MELIDVKTDNITDYKKTSLLLAFPYCTGKCKGCQNEYLWKDPPTKNYNPIDILNLYNKLNTHEAVVMAGLEPFDSFNDVLELINLFVFNEKAIDIVIYTGYNKDEYIKLFQEKLIKVFKSGYIDNKRLIIKLGRYDEDQKQSWNSYILGVNLSTKNQSVLVEFDPDNQFAEEQLGKIRIS